MHLVTFRIVDRTKTNVHSKVEATLDAPTPMTPKQMASIAQLTRTIDSAVRLWRGTAAARQAWGAQRVGQEAPKP